VTRFLLYGATGYVGRAVAGLALERGLTPVLAGRSDTVRSLADELGAPAVVVGVDDAGGLARAMADVPAVLNCAGPFHRTFRPMLDACLATGTHYLDITGEPAVFEAAAAADAAATAAGVMVLSGVGFDVVPTDCLGAHLAARLPTATHLRLAFMQTGPAALPPGTVQTMVETGTGQSSRLHRVDGVVTEANPRPRIEVDFGTGAGPVTAVLFTWGDVFLAEKSTGIRNVADHMVIPARRVKATDQLDRMRWLLRFKAVRELVKRQMPTGATPEQRAASATHVWGEVVDAGGARAVSRLHGPEAGLVWTSRTALDVVAQVLADNAPPGHQTPSTAYGPDLVLEPEEVTREDVH